MCNLMAYISFFISTFTGDVALPLGDRQLHPAREGKQGNYAVKQQGKRWKIEHKINFKTG